MRNEEREGWPCVICHSPGGKKHVTKDGVDGVCHATCLKRSWRDFDDGAETR